MSWKAVAVIAGFVIYFMVFIVSGVYLLTDNTCAIDKTSLEKRCLKAFEHYKGRQVNF